MKRNIKGFTDGNKEAMMRVVTVAQQTVNCILPAKLEKNHPNKLLLLLTGKYSCFGPGVLLSSSFFNVFVRVYPNGKCEFRTEFILQI